eukprot:TRINITY_DN46722_c0_g1_i2.p4 TRINITY_DN46722_c0_g1~~TRINITY_DN46722_c0_g1_i2.p4  ORF type:complete len:133 (+),score=43.17 TRINITY_DN46722_c0_g1_i2:586-984(+)
MATEGSWDHNMFYHLVKQRVTEQMYNSGIILYRKGPCTDSFLRCWHGEYMERCHGRGDAAFWDQCALHHALRQHPVKYGTLSSKLNWRNAFLPNHCIPPRERSGVLLDHDRKGEHVQGTLQRYGDLARDSGF